MENEMTADIIAEYRADADKMDCGELYQPTTIYIRQLLNRIEAARKRESESIERIVRDAIIDYQDFYPHAPNDEAERDLIDRAKRGNSWLVAHGYEPEKIKWSKEETPCL